MPIEKERDRTVSLIITLIEDVIAARQRLDAKDTQTGRRDVARASLAAMEGEIWLAREHVRESLQSLEELTPLADLALREHTYTIAESGKLIEQVRSVPLPTAMRLVVAQAQIICPSLAVDFETAGWANVRRAVAIRNRITHPRPENNLDVSNEDLQFVASALSWTTATVDYIMASTNLVLTKAREFLDKLLAGDPNVLAEYQAALESGS